MGHKSWASKTSQITKYKQSFGWKLVLFLDFCDSVFPLSCQEKIEKKIHLKHQNVFNFKMKTNNPNLKWKKFVFKTPGKSLFTRSTFAISYYYYSNRLFEALLLKENKINQVWHPARLIFQKVTILSCLLTVTIWNFHYYS